VAQVRLDGPQGDRHRYAITGLLFLLFGFT
jgi:hypothetical protein